LSWIFGYVGRTYNKLKVVSTCITCYCSLKYADTEHFCTKMHKTVTVFKLDAGFLGDYAMDSVTSTCYTCTMHDTLALKILHLLL